MIKEYSVSGTALTGENLEARDVTIVVQDGIITAVEDEISVSHKWICPAFFNAHTHLADTVAMDLPCNGTLDELVTPPHGLKHQILAHTPDDRLITAMNESMKEMIHSGTAGFADFREGGKEGVLTLKQAASSLPIHPVILGREGGEVNADGAGISSVRDVSSSQEIVDRMKKQGKIVGFHAGERDFLDIDAALDMNPDFLVHCTHARSDQVKRIADEDIPVVLCCRSNFLLGVSSGNHHPPVQEMLNAGVRLLIGTDNVMFVQPDMMQELSFVHTVYGVPTHDLLKSATSGFPPIGVSHCIEKGNLASFFVLDTSWGNIHYSRDIESTIVKRAPLSHFCARIF
ncbi:amidohydrolase family protein [Methanospirillum purgamenti]|jgi:cytosine/adenosine deaminase-related metal-dependent hydrolase|uniref:Amidohydrolase family protein n=1 Tax=Methanospirillum hungatei TaxID=2203 RepID=A0A8F5VPF2_METHU|nr:amidohydrolase family protein [Methanospirillum hungatei]QXO95040.1 amidohydrolase family protein [Methanospirillum hungatei]